MREQPLQPAAALPAAVTEPEPEPQPEPQSPVAPTPTNEVGATGAIRGPHVDKAGSIVPAPESREPAANRGSSSSGGQELSASDRFALFVAVLLVARALLPRAWAHLSDLFSLH